MVLRSSVKYILLNQACTCVVAIGVSALLCHRHIGAVFIFLVNIIPFIYGMISLCIAINFKYFCKLRSSVKISDVKVVVSISRGIVYMFCSISKSQTFGSVHIYVTGSNIWICKAVSF